MIFEANKLVSGIGLAFGNFVAATKQLKVLKVGAQSDKRKIVVSTNWLNFINLPAGTPIVERVVDSAITVTPARLGDVGVKKVYQRGYKGNRAEESLLDTRSQTLIDSVVGDESHVHITFEKEKVTIRPIPNPKAFMDAELHCKCHTRSSEGLFTDVPGIVSLVRNVRAGIISVATLPEFTGSDEELLLQLQLRRMGYECVQQGDTLLAIHSNCEQITRILDESQARSFIAPVEIKFNTERPYGMFGACTAGVDIYASEKHGFETSSILEWRPHEKRDIKEVRDPVTGVVDVQINDKSETGALCALMNAKKLKYIFNEDIYLFDKANVKAFQVTENIFHVSAQCDDFSSLKTLEERAKAVANLETTRDMVFDILKIIEWYGFSTVLLENVANFGNSTECKLFCERLKQLGYKTYVKTLNAKNFNGYTMRNRTFVFASALDVEFVWPEPEARTVHFYNDLINGDLTHLRDVSHTTTVKKGIDTGRIRLAGVGDDVAPTLTKSQNRQVKDSVYVYLDGRYYMPEIELVKSMMGLDDGFDMHCFSKELQTEIVGQAVDIPMHQRIMESVKSHLTKYWLGVQQIQEVILEPVVTASQSVVDVVKDVLVPETKLRRGEQLCLF